MNTEILQKIGKLLNCHDLTIFKENVNILESDTEPESEKTRSIRILYNILMSRFYSSEYYEQLKNTQYQKIFEVMLVNHINKPNTASENDFYNLLYFIDNAINLSQKKIKLNRVGIKGKLVKPLLVVTGFISICIGEAIYVKSEVAKQSEKTLEKPIITLIPGQNNDREVLEIIEEYNKSKEEIIDVPKPDVQIQPTPAPNEPLPTLTVVSSKTESEFYSASEDQKVLKKIK